MYKVVTADSWETVASNFKTEAGAWGWVDAHDYGQYELEGGLMVIQYSE